MATHGAPQGCKTIRTSDNRHKFAYNYWFKTSCTKKSVFFICSLVYSI